MHPATFLCQHCRLLQSLPAFSASLVGAAKLQQFEVWGFEFRGPRQPLVASIP